jgi:cation diffusion facilitator CzcD-associated flavoprotein CzcO
MDEKTYGVKEREHIPGMTLHRYLTDFAKQNGVYERTRFNHKLESITPQRDDTWVLEILNNGSHETIHTKKLILATGLTSMPNMPTYKGQDTFGAPLFHAKDFHIERETLKTAKTAVIIGGAKSAYDVAWAYCDAGVQVNLVIRPNGNGLCGCTLCYINLALTLV